MRKDLALTLENDISEISRMADKFCVWGESAGIPENVIGELGVVLDDLTSNIILYGFPDGGRHSINISLKIEGKSLSGVITDDGVPFNPLSLKSPDISAPIDERKIGGLGIVLARAMLDDIRYERQGDRNILSLKKNF